VASLLLIRWTTQRRPGVPDVVWPCADQSSDGVASFISQDCTNQLDHKHVLSTLQDINQPMDHTVHDDEYKFMGVETWRPPLRDLAGRVAAI
jgi:hypothetical protein